MLFGLGKGRDKKARLKSKLKKADATIAEAKTSFGRNSRSRGRDAAHRALTGGVNKLFHGVAVRARDENCCQAVEDLSGQRFLSEEAPLLPLADCSNPQGCRCVYEHFDERRDNLRRESDVGLPVRTHQDEKRAGLGRRITDG